MHRPFSVERVSMIRTLIAALLLLAAQSGAPPTPAPKPTGPVYVGNPATHFRLESRPLGVDGDGAARWLVIAHFRRQTERPQECGEQSTIARRIFTPGGAEHIAGSIRLPIRQAAGVCRK